MGEYLDDAELSVVEEYFDATNFYDHQTPDPTAHRWCGEAFTSWSLHSAQAAMAEATEKEGSTDS